ncbi:MAG: NAD(P)H-dependent oxidoreductase [Thaumarchaeota archaeon]|nr:NAD(P)H-dependent oxidoreductase [Nitrososphaerota archaeon]
MTKTLVVKYVPRGERSNTKKILTEFKSKMKNSTIEELDLVKDVPDMFLDDNLIAYIQRDYLKQSLSAEQKNLLSKMDKMTEQVKSSDIVVLAYPMFNFSMPAVVKAWFDSIMLKGHTWNAQDGKYAGLMKGKKALTIVSSGGSYSTGPMKAWEHAVSLSNSEFQFMGFSEVKGILAEGMNGAEDTKSSNLAKALEEIQVIAHEWYQ